MSYNSEEMRLRDIAIGLRAEIDELNFRQEKAALKISHLQIQIQDLSNHQRTTEIALKASQQFSEKLQQDILARDAEIVAIRKSRTWLIGSFVLAPTRWMKRSKR